MFPALCVNHLSIIIMTNSNRLCYLSTSTKSSLSRAHLALGQNTRTRQPASRLSSMWRAWASWFTVCTQSNTLQGCNLFFFKSVSDEVYMMQIHPITWEREFSCICIFIKTTGGNRLSDQWTWPDSVCVVPYLDALLLIRALRLQIGPVIIGSFHTQEAVCRVANPAGQDAVPQHGVHHRAFTITGSGNNKITLKVVGYMWKQIYFRLL